MNFKIGDLVETIDDRIAGTVILVHQDLISIEDKEGFIFNFKAHELIKVEGSSNIFTKVSYEDIEAVKVQKQIASKKPKQKIQLKSKQEAPVVIDLHIGQLVQFTKGLTNFDMLNLQLNTAKHQLEKAIKNRWPKIVFIHGVGEGVLKMELHTLFRRYEQVTFYDADYKTFGLGATEVRIFQNP